MPIGSDARFPLNTDPSLVPAQPAMKTLVNPPAAKPLDFSYFDGGPAPLTSPASSPAPVGSGVGSVWNFLASLFGGGGSAQPQVPAQGMRGLLQTPMPRGRGAPGTNALGNPLGRF
jgi:hypothetical protein